MYRLNWSAIALLTSAPTGPHVAIDLVDDLGLFRRYSLGARQWGALHAIEQAREHSIADQFRQINPVGKLIQTPLVVLLELALLIPVRQAMLLLAGEDVAQRGGHLLVARILGLHHVQALQSHQSGPATGRVVVRAVAHLHGPVALEGIGWFSRREGFTVALTLGVVGQAHGVELA